MEEQKGSVNIRRVAFAINLVTEKEEKLYKDICAVCYENNIDSEDIVAIRLDVFCGKDIVFRESPFPRKNSNKPSPENNLFGFNVLLKITDQKNREFCSQKWTAYVYVYYKGKVITIDI